MRWETEGIMDQDFGISCPYNNCVMNKKANCYFEEAIAIFPMKSKGQVNSYYNFIKANALV